MLRKIIDRVKEIEDGSIEATSIFNSTESNRYTRTFSNLNDDNYQRKLVFESNILKGIDSSQEKEESNYATLNRKQSQPKLILGSEEREAIKIHYNDTFKEKNFTKSSIMSNSISQPSMNYPKCYKNLKITKSKNIDKDATAKVKDMSPNLINNFETDQTISLFSNKVSNIESNQKGGFITPRDRVNKVKVQAWGTPDNTDQTTDRVFAMLQMNKNIINKYQQIKDQNTFSSLSPKNSKIDSPNSKNQGNKIKKIKPRRVKMEDFYPRFGTDDKSNDISFSKNSNMVKKTSGNIPFSFDTSDNKENNERNMKLESSLYDLSEIECPSSIEFCRVTPCQR
mmetsp:Transcript_24770/g.21995  ORF Transcript_24770/g.21995 Transcript_24770/m.21995 type:complete len:339 (+) Transcript_24770:237-1253(+)